MSAERVPSAKLTALRDARAALERAGLDRTCISVHDDDLAVEALAFGATRTDCNRDLFTADEGGLLAPVRIQVYGHPSRDEERARLRARLAELE